MKSAALHALSPARFSILHIRGAAARHVQRRVCLAAQVERRREECALLCEEIRIKDARMGRIPPQRRPHYSPLERMAILELRAARGWSVKQTADAFLITPETIAHGRRVSRKRYLFSCPSRSTGSPTSSGTSSSA